ncbi:VTT domain-containing protein [Salinicola salarius]|uniref:TVP38/TMEM64 family protein n=1 Tax=Salinicola salarius TaxID=430457 RepID=UPI0023E4650D|nr:VTT domain-containing protein [Salinicola salarius]MDF3919887.1 VTT domain-containing protein [Salinicola salarius]
MFLTLALLVAGLVGWGGFPREALETLHPLALLIAMAGLPALGIPMTPFYILAGLRFGVPGGLLFSAVATLLNLLLCYAIASGQLRPVLRTSIERRFPALAGLDDARQDAWRVTFLIKLVPGVPMFLKHYALGVAGVPLSIFLSVALLTTGPYGAAFVVLGQSALTGNVGQAMVAAGLLALIVTAVNIGLGRRARRRSHGKPCLERRFE